MNRSPHAPYAESPADFAIGLRPIPEAAWLEGGETPDAVRTRKRALLDTAPARVWAETPGSRLAQTEAASLVARAVGRPVDDGNLAPLLAAALDVSDDLCLLERLDGRWTLTALSLSAGTFFTADQVIGLNLAELHGPVPGFGERLLPRVTRIFDALRPELILERRNWTVVGSAEPHLPDPAPVRASLASIPHAEAGSRLHLRVERQTLRRLPASGGLLFTIRVWTESLDTLAADPDRLGAFRRAWAVAAPAFRTYKGLAGYDPLVEAFLARNGPEL